MTKEQERLPEERRERSKRLDTKQSITSAGGVRDGQGIDDEKSGMTVRWMHGSLRGVTMHADVDRRNMKQESDYRSSNERRETQKWMRTAAAEERDKRHSPMVPTGHSLHSLHSLPHSSPSDQMSLCGIIAPANPGLHLRLPLPFAL